MTGKYRTGPESFIESWVCTTPECSRSIYADKARCTMVAKDPTREAKEAVITAAEEIYSQAYRGREGEATFVIHEAFFRDLGSAIKNLRATRQPKAVKPEEVPLGARFQYLDDGEGRASSEIFRRIEDENGKPMSLCERGWEACYFVGEARIIPIEEPEE